MNMFVYSGRFTRDPELKDSNGNKYVFFSLAQDVPVKDGERRPIFPTFTAFGKTAEAICKYFKKGSGKLLVILTPVLPKVMERIQRLLVRVIL